MLTAAVVFLGCIVVALMAAVSYLLIAIEQAQRADHCTKLLLAAQEKRIAALEQDAGLDGGLYKTWRRSGNSG